MRTTLTGGPRGAVAVALLAVLAAGCGSSSNGSNRTPRSELDQGFSTLASADALTTTIRLDTTPAALHALAARQGDHLSGRDASLITGARLTVVTHKDGSRRDVELLGQDAGHTFVDIRAVGQTVYLRGDVRGILALAGKPNVYGNLAAEVAHMPAFVQDLLRGRWVSLDASAAQALSGSGSQSAAPNQATLDRLRRTLDRDVTVTRAGTDSRGDHLVLTGNSRTLARDLQADVASGVPGGAMLRQRLDSARVPDRQVRVDAWVADGALTQISIDLAQFARPGAGGGHLPLTLTFRRSAGTVMRPTGATPVDLSQLGSILGAVGGGMGGSSTSSGSSGSAG